MTDDLWGDMAGAECGRFKLSNRDQALLLIRQHDLESQLIAIKGVLRQNREAEQQVAEAIKALDAQIHSYASDDDEYQMHMENHWVDTLHGAVFQDAAHSMSAVGMIAPLFESLLVSIFEGLRERFETGKTPVAESVRGPRSATKFWDPRLTFVDGKWQNLGLVQGTKQISDAIGLFSFLPEGFASMHTALTAYRNCMFHNGFEWPVKDRKKFDERIVAEAWPEGWFTKSTSGDEPWIFYMSADFIEHCLHTIDQVLKGVGRYLEQGRIGQN